VYFVGDTDAAETGNLLQPRRHIHPVTEYVLTVDNDVTEIDADPVLNSLIVGLTNVEFGSPFLHRDGPIDGVNDTRELGQQTVPHEFDHTPAMRIDLRLDQL